MSSPRPISPDALAHELADRARSLDTPAVVAIDGAPATQPDALAERIVDVLRSAGTPAGHVRDRDFWRDASLRYEYGREDVDAYLEWLDAPALSREVIGALRTRGEYLPSLRDPDTNRATRAAPVQLGARGVLILSGALLLRHGLSYDLSVHLTASPAALERRTPADQLWTLPAFARYESGMRPASHASVVVRCDDPRHPAVLGLPGRAQRNR